MKTKNLDISMLGNHMLVFRNELKKSGSGEALNVDSYDMARLESYIGKMERDLQHVVSEPRLDLPKFHPVEIPMPEVPSDYNLDSPAIVYCLRMMDAAYFELLSSQSSDRSNGLEIADADRFKKLLERLKSWVASIKDTQEIDAPEMANTNDK